jgi:hypothetical protein|tara:strand:+ start:1697 stop:2104 length:408 start_codon:yes stop_codon:yes gene_type:complete
MGLFKDCGCGCDGRKQQEKFINSIISGLTFFIVANPETFRLMRRVLGPRIATPTGCPSTTGLLLHSTVFFLIVWGMMNIKNEAPVIPEGEEEEEDVGQYIIKPKRMTDVVPEPGTKEDKFVDTGLKLGSMDLSSI